MSPLIGFLMVTHRDPDQVAHLTSRLSNMFGNPPIAIHHDFAQTALERGRFPANVRFVEPSVPTKWGDFSVVRAQLAALKLLVRTADPDWIILLSSADYPIQTAERICLDLASTPFDAFLDSRPIQDLGRPYHDGSLGGTFPFNQRLYLQTAYNRYVAYPLLTRSMAKRLKTPVEAWVLKWKWLTERTSPFGDGLRCFGGDAWFTINRRVANYLLTDSPLLQKLTNHYVQRAVPEESFYQSILGNTPEFQVALSNLRFTDWTGCYAHPRTLGRKDFPQLLASDDHFARKFPLDIDLLSELDQRVAAAGNLRHTIQQS